MSKPKQFNEENLLYSCIYGSGIYWDTGKTVQDPIGRDCREGVCSPLLRNVITGESVFMKLIDCSDDLLDKYVEKIQRPPDRKYILWPVDIVSTYGKNVSCKLLVSQEYTDRHSNTNTQSGNYALLFSYVGLPDMVSGSLRMQQIGPLTWKNRFVQRIACNIMKAMDVINRCGYVYEDIHLSRFFFKENDEVFLNYSKLALSMEDIFSADAEFTCAFDRNEYPIEFTEPAVYRGLRKSLDFQSQNYSLAALLFYLFTGQYAYDGRLLTGYLDGTIQQHYTKFRDYIKMPVFIFDPLDKENALGSFAEEEKVIALWNELPKQLQSVFISVLRKENAERTVCSDNPTPGMWLQYFRALGWTKVLEDS